MIPSELPIQVLPDPRRTPQGVIAGIPVRWQVYDVAHSRTLYMGNLITGIDCRGGIMQVGVSIEGDDTRAIERLLGIAAAMSIETARELADPDAVMTKCLGPSDKP